jgi:hypothetical protein
VWRENDEPCAVDHRTIQLRVEDVVSVVDAADDAETALVSPVLGPLERLLQMPLIELDYLDLNHMMPYRHETDVSPSLVQNLT